MTASKRKTILIVTGVVLAFILGIVLIFRFGSYLVAYLIFGPSEVSEDEKIVEFDDGSVLERTGGPTYEHSLGDMFIFERNDTTFECSIYTQPEHTDILDEHPNRVFKYAFSPDGYIAYRVLSEKLSYESDETVIYELHYYSIVSDKTVLYDGNTDTHIEFESQTALVDYCEENNIKLGVWYYPQGYSSTPEHEYLEIGSWEIRCSGSCDYEAVYLNNRMMFAGTIDRCFVTDRYFGFHFVLREGYEYSIEENPIIEFNPDVVVGKKLFADIYSDSYVFVDTQTNEYTIFSDKKSINDYAESLEISTDWEKLEFKD